MRNMKVKVIPVIIGELGTAIPKLEKWLEQIPGISEISISLEDRTISTS